MRTQRGFDHAEDLGRRRGFSVSTTSQSALAAAI